MIWLFSRPKLRTFLTIKWMSMGIPIVNLADFLGDHPARNAQFVQQLDKAYDDTGFVAVKNHGIPEQLISDMYAKAQAFFLACRHKKSIWNSRARRNSVAKPLLEKNTTKAVLLATWKGFTSMGKRFWLMVLIKKNILPMLRSMRLMDFLPRITLPTAIFKSRVRLYYRQSPFTW